MTSRLLLPAVVICGLLTPMATAADMQVAPTAEPLEAAELAPEIASQLAPSGWSLAGGRTAVEFWPLQKWAVRDGFTPSAEVLYPFTVGELVGVARYTKSGTDFRGQKIGRGLYTVRYAQQPVDGNHVGTSDTRDFFLLLPVAEDTSPEVMAEGTLWPLSAKAVESTHPAMLCLLATPADAEPGLVVDEARELTAICFENPTSAGALKVTLVLVGHAAE